MAYPHHFEKFGPQSKALSHKPVYFRPEWTNLNRITRSAKIWGPSAIGFGVASGLFVVFTTEWEWACSKIPFYGSKFSTQE